MGKERKYWFSRESKRKRLLNVIYKIKGMLRNHLPLYAVLRCVENAKNDKMQKLVLSFKDPEVFPDTSVLLVEHGGDQFEDKIIFDISIGTNGQIRSGFFAIMRMQLEWLDFADHFRFTPIIRWGKGIQYYDSEMDMETTNAYEYYFKPASEIAHQDVKKCRNIIHAPVSYQYRGFFLDYATNVDAYKLDEPQIAVLAGIYKKYVALNDRTERYMAQQIEDTLCGKRTLGVHIRGTDFKRGFACHPKFVAPIDYLKQAMELFANENYEQIFLATDDMNALRLFKNAFNSKLVYYVDALRADKDTGVHMLESQRPLHHYRLGLEVLRDVYTLACCDGLIAGKSQVSFAARYISIALDRSFEDLIILDKGLN